MKKILFLVFASVCWLARAGAQTATVTSSSTVLNSAGGQVTFSVSLSYPSNVSAVALSAKPPSATWVHLSTNGDTAPNVKPEVDETTDPASVLSVFGWTYSIPPANGAAFTFVLRYPDGLTGNQVITFSGHSRLNGVLTPITVAAVTLTPTPVAPAITTQPASVSVASGANATFTVVATGTPTPTLKWQRSTNNGATFADLAADSTYSGVTTDTLAIAATTPAMNGYKFRVIATSGDLSAVTSTAATLSVNFSPTISVQPKTQAVSTGGNLVLSVVANGFPAPTYQWKKGATNLTDGGRISGATTATLTISTVQTGDEGGYSVVVSNTTAPSATSSTANITLVSAGFSATHALVGAGYTPGGTVTVTNTINYSSDLSSLLWSVLLPTGWSFESTVNAGSPSTQPTLNDISMLDWTWSAAPPSGSTFTYTLKTPSTGGGSQQLVSVVEYGVGTTPIRLVATPDPLVVNPIFFHSADINQNYKIDASELTRVIVLYNTRFDTGAGKVRTGSYQVQSGTADGFGTDVSRDPSAVVTLGTYHAADYNRNGKIDAAELTRVIVLYNTRFDTGAGKVRTGYYKAATGTTTVDSYTTDALRAP